MNKLRFWVAVLFALISFESFSQFLINGTVTDNETKDPLIGVTVVVKGTTNGTTTDINGQFSLQIKDGESATIVFSYIGYDPIEKSASKDNRNISVSMGAGAIMMEEVKIVGTRVKKDIQNSPVAVARLGAIAIKETPAPGFYEGLANLKGVDMTSASLGFRIINTRGFNSTSPVRTLQLIDGVDNQAPGLNFSLGNFVGASELDVESVDIIFGANTALYGPNAFNGVIKINTKDPFKYQGFSMSLKKASRDLFDGSLRYAGVFSGFSEEGKEGNKLRRAVKWNKVFKDRLAMKFNTSYLTARDWTAENYDQRYDTPNAPNDLQGYDAVNVYGEVGFNSGASLRPGPGQPADTNLVIYRDGYREIDLSDNGTKGIKLQGGLFYKLTEKTIASFRINHGSGTTVYQGDNRYSIRDITFNQFKGEIAGENFFLKAYRTTENAGNSYDLVFTATQLMDQAKTNSVWFRDYFDGYEMGRVDSGFTVEQSLAYARTYANGVGSGLFGATAKLQPGTPEFNAALNDITSTAGYLEGGTKFVDESSMNHFQGQYDFKLNEKYPSMPESWIVGGSYRQFNPVSFGTIFSDTLNVAGDINSGFDKITTWEYGFYTSMQKRAFADRVNFIASLRMDDHQNFDVNFSPAFSAIIDLTEEDKLRFTVTSAIRNPTLQDQFLLYDIGFLRLEGNRNGRRLMTLENFNGPDGYLATGNVEILELDPIRPEKLKSVEMGYRGIILGGLYVDMNAYYSEYTDFIGFVYGLNDPTNNQAFQFLRVAGNSSDKVNTYGGDIGLNYYLGKHYSISGNYTYAKFVQTDSEDPLIPNFNTPEHKYNLGFGGRNFGGFGFNVTYKWVEGFFYAASPQFTGNVPTYDLLDAQVNYTFPDTKATFKLGLSNALDNVHFEAYGAPYLGRFAYLSFTFGL